MNQILRFALSFVIATLATLVSFSAEAQSDMNLLGPGDPGYDTLVQRLGEMRHDADAVRCVFYQCQSLRSHPRRTWRHANYYESCYQNHLKQKEQADYKPLMNPPTVSALLCSHKLETELPKYNKEVGERVFSRYERPKAAPAKVAPKPAVTQADLAELRAYASSSAAALAEKPPQVTYKPGTPEFEKQRYLQWAKAHPKAAAAAKANRTAQLNKAKKSSVSVRINCIPEYVSIVKIADNGDLTLFIHRGADIYQLHRCLPDHNFDPVKVVSENIAASTVPYYLEYADRPIRNNKLHFHKGRWHIKRSDWKKPGKEFFADFFKKHQGKSFGFALQGGQRLLLAAQPPPEAPTNAAPKTGSNTPAKHGLYQHFVPSEKQTRMASTYAAPPSAIQDVSMSDSASVYQPRRQRERAETRLASIDMSSRGSIDTSETKSAGGAYIRAGPRVTRASYILTQRYRRGGGADLNNTSNVRHDAQERLSHRRHHGPYAFG
jgi:hypothetical protein